MINKYKDDTTLDAIAQQRAVIRNMLPETKERRLDIMEVKRKNNFMTPAESIHSSSGILGLSHYASNLNLKLNNNSERLQKNQLFGISGSIANKDKAIYHNNNSIGVLCTVPSEEDNNKYLSYLARNDVDQELKDIISANLSHISHFSESDLFSVLIKQQQPLIYDNIQRDIGMKYNYITLPKYNPEKYQPEYQTANYTPESYNEVIFYPRMLSKITIIAYDKPSLDNLIRQKVHEIFPKNTKVEYGLINVEIVKKYGSMKNNFFKDIEIKDVNYLQSIVPNINLDYRTNSNNYIKNISNIATEDIEQSKLKNEQDLKPKIEYTKDLESQNIAELSKKWRYPEWHAKEDAEVRIKNGAKWCKDMLDERCNKLLNRGGGKKWIK